MSSTSVAVKQMAHLLASPDNFQVSTRSKWSDEVWVLDNETFGAPPADARFNWAVRMPDGSLLTDAQWASLLESFKRFAWSLFSDPRDGQPLKAGSSGILAVGIRYLAYWMAYRGYGAFCELDRASAELFFDDLAENVIDRGTSEESAAVACSQDEDSTEIPLAVLRTNAGVSTRLMTWRNLWRQREALRDAGIPPLPERPFEISISKLADQICERSLAKIPPIPDEVAIPIINAATRFIFTPAEDVIRLQERYLERVSGNDPSNHPTLSSKVSLWKRSIEDFEFSVIPGETSPWREKIESEVYQNIRDPRGGTYYPGKVAVDSVQQLRQLIFEVRDACAIVIQSQAGVRISELCSLRSGWNEATSLPACIEVKKSKTGLNELFYLKGKISKTVPLPLEVEWLLGSRPLGSDSIPSPVRAVIVLERLFDYWRKLATRTASKEALFITFKSRRGLVISGETILAAAANTLSDGQNIFVRKYVDLSSLPARSKSGEDLQIYKDPERLVLRTHQWRKTFAQFVFMTDSRMIPAIAQQFQHLSLAMTEQGYISNDPELLESLHSSQKASTVAFFYRYVTESPKLSGRLAKLIDKHQDELKSMVSGLSPMAAEREISNWVEARDLKIFFSSHGKCFIRASPSDARCHQVGGTSNWNNRAPNYQTREPGVCLGCSCFVVDDEHVEFWRNRLIDNKAAFDSLDKMGKRSHGRVFRERADQAAAVLSALNIPTDMPE